MLDKDNTITDILRENVQTYRNAVTSGKYDAMLVSVGMVATSNKDPRTGND